MGIEIGMIKWRDGAKMGCVVIIILNAMLWKNIVLCKIQKYLTRFA